MSRQQSIQTYLAEALRTLDSLHALAPQIEAAGNALIAALQRGNALLTAGNGGSAAEAMHLAEELTGKYHHPRKALAAICLNADPTALTCIANDWDFGAVFARQVEALGRPGDVLVGFTTSGNSENVLRAFVAAKARGMMTIGLLGRDGGRAVKEGLCDLPLVVPAEQTNHVQEAHQVILHLLLEQVDGVFVGAGGN